MRWSLALNCSTHKTAINFPSPPIWALAINATAQICPLTSSSVSFLYIQGIKLVALTLTYSLIYYYYCVSQWHHSTRAREKCWWREWFWKFYKWKIIYYAHTQTVRMEWKREKLRRTHNENQIIIRALALEMEISSWVIVGKTVWLWGWIDVHWAFIYALCVLTRVSVLETVMIIRTSSGFIHT